MVNTAIIILSISLAILAVAAIIILASILEKKNLLVSKTGDDIEEV